MILASLYAISYLCSRFPRVPFLLESRRVDSGSLSKQGRRRTRGGGLLWITTTVEIFIQKIRSGTIKSSSNFDWKIVFTRSLTLFTGWKYVNGLFSTFFFSSSFFPPSSFKHFYDAYPLERHVAQQLLPGHRVSRVGFKNTQRPAV